MMMANRILHLIGWMLTIFLLVFIASAEQLGNFTKTKETTKQVVEILSRNSASRELLKQLLNVSCVLNQPNIFLTCCLTILYSVEKSDNATMY